MWAGSLGVSLGAQILKKHPAHDINLWLLCISEGRKKLPAGPSQVLPHGVGTPVNHLPEEQSWSFQGCAAPRDSSLITQGLNGVCW